MAREHHWVYLYDDAPRVGSGYRNVYADVGYKWVHIKSANPVAEQSERTRISRKKWDDIVRRTNYRKANTEEAMAYFEKYGRFKKTRHIKALA